jgi:4-diphosphocytidyl-2-C-methyl-D-erythritol kinase
VTRGRSASLEAPGKVNLVLRVLGRRSDGYHEIATLFQAIDLCDNVRVSVDPDASGVDLALEGPDLGPLEENLAYRAAERFCDRYGVEAGVRIELLKRIPAGGGLGGGSSDAAAVLRLLSALTGHGEGLQALAADLGSDVPFFVAGSATSLGAGRGELLTALPALPEKDVVLALPPVHVSTAWAYGRLAEVRAAVGSRDRDPGGDEALPAGAAAMFADWDGVLREAVNDFQPLVSEAFPEVARSLEGLRESGAALAMLSGSGGACFGLFDEAARAEAIAAELTGELGWPFLATRTLRAPPEPRSTD